MPVTISSECLAGVLAEAAASPGVEVCGLLLGTRDADGERIVEARRCRNVARDPSRTFEIDPAALLGAYRAARGGGSAILGCYHSHPTGRAEPSQRDAADAAANGWLWLIVGGGEAKLWRAVADGAAWGRFDAVDWVGS